MSFPLFSAIRVIQMTPECQIRDRDHTYGIVPNSYSD